MNLLFLGNRWERDDIPLFLIHYMADQIVLVESLHNDDDDAVLFTIQSAHERVVIPFVNARSPSFGKSIIWFKWIIENNHIRPSTSQYPAYGGRHPKALCSRQEIVY